MLLRFIFSMIGSAKWLAELLQPVSEDFSPFCISDSFTFSVILYINVPLLETVQNCAGALYSGCFGPVIIAEPLFFEFMYLSTKGIEFSSKDIMYVQISGVSMGSLFRYCFDQHFLFDVMRAYRLRNVKSRRYTYVMLMILFLCLILSTKQLVFADS